MKTMQIKSMIGALLCVLIAGCHQEYPHFDTEYSSVRFIYNAARQDSVVYSFALHPGTSEGIVEIPLRVIGVTHPQVRRVCVEINPRESTATAENFTIEKCEVSQNSFTGTLRVIVRKTSRLDEQPAIISLKLCKNEFFHAAPINESTFRIILTNRLARPSDWPESFGIYSMVKHRFVIQVTQRGTDYKKWNTQELTYYLGLLNKALYEYNREHPGNPLTDENGLTVTF